MMKDFCEYSKLAITSRPHWKNIEIDTNYSSSFYLIGDNILLTESKGHCKLEGMIKYLEIREKIIQESLLNKRPYIELRDYSKETGVPSRQIRVLFTNCLVQETESGKMRGFIGFNASAPIRWIFNISLQAVNSQATLKMVKDYQAAITTALSILNNNPINNTSSNSEAESVFSKQQIQDYIENILQFMESSTWNPQDLESHEVDLSHPFKILYDVISVIKMDFHTMLAQERQNTKLLSASEEKYRVLSENLHDVIFIIDKGFQLKSIAGNTFFTLGYTKDELAAMDPDQLIELFHPTDLPKIMHKLEAATSNAEKQKIEIRFKQQDNSYSWIELSFAPLQESNTVTKIHCFARNIDKQKKNEEKFNSLQQQLVDTALQAGKMERTAGIMHDIGNILNGVNISIENLNIQIKNIRVSNLTQASEMIFEHIEHIGHFLREDVKGKLLPEYLKSVAASLVLNQGKMQSEIENLRTKMAAIKDVIITQQKYNRIEKELEKFELGTTIDDALILQRSVLNHHGIQVEKKYPENEKFFIKAQRSKLIHVLINLFKNASEAMSGIPADERKIEIKINTVLPEKTVITISDNGGGIEPANLENIFRYGMTTKKLGHGFGLHTSKNYIKEMGGRLYARSEGAGKGSDLIIEIPK